MFDRSLSEEEIGDLHHSISIRRAETEAIEDHPQIIAIQANSFDERHQEYLGQNFNEALSDNNLIVQNRSFRQSMVDDRDIPNISSEPNYVNINEIQRRY